MWLNVTAPDVDALPGELHQGRMDEPVPIKTVCPSCEGSGEMRVARAVV
jgi:hypothetical protein